MEVVLEGMLERCLNDKRRDWKKSYFVFQHNFSTGSKTLECFKDNNWKKQEPRCVYNLYSEFSARKVELKNRFAFELVTVDKVYLLSASAENLRQQWLDVLLKAAGISVFNVSLIESPPNAYGIMKNFQGKLELHIAKSFIMLVAPDLSKITWTFAIIRRYKAQSGFFIIEVGRKSETGEGIFRFECKNPSELFDVLDKTVKDRIKEKGLLELIENQSISPDSKGVRLNNTQLLPQYNPVTSSEYSRIFVNRQPAIPTDDNYDVLFLSQKQLQSTSVSAPISDQKALHEQKPSAFEDTLNPTQSLNIQDETLSLLVLNTQAAEEEHYEDMSSLGNTSIVNDKYDMENHPSPLERILASSPTFNQNALYEQEEQYEDMSSKRDNTSGSGGKAITKNESNIIKKSRPLPPPRVKPTTPIVNDVSAALKIADDESAALKIADDESAALKIADDVSAALKMNLANNNTEYENLLNFQMENIGNEYVHLDSGKYNEKHKHSEMNSAPKNDRIANSVSHFNALNQSSPSQGVIKKPVKPLRSTPLKTNVTPNSIVTQNNPQKKYSLPDS